MSSVSLELLLLTEGAPCSDVERSLASQSPNEHEVRKIGLQWDATDPHVSQAGRQLLPVQPKQLGYGERADGQANTGASGRRADSPSVSLALPPVGWHRTWAQLEQSTTVWAWLKTVEIETQPGHLTSC